MSTIELSHLTFTYPERSFSLDVEDKHFADPMVAMIKVALERESERAAKAGIRMNEEDEAQAQA